MRKLREWKAEKAAEVALFADLVPDLEPAPPMSGHKADLVARIEDMRSDPILEVYDRFAAGKRSPRKSGQIQVQCPMANHEDSHPSASLSTEKNAWFCHA